eukprot:2737358-Prymnesium_polylepis.1
MGQRGLAIRPARGRCSRRPHSRHTAQSSCAPVQGKLIRLIRNLKGVIFIRGGGLLYVGARFGTCFACLP